MADRTTALVARTDDLLGRRVLAEALAEKLYDHAIGPRGGDPGPTVVTIEGPWGSGKSTLLDFVRDCLPQPRTSVAVPGRLTVRMASRLLRDGGPPPPSGDEPSAPRDDDHPAAGPVDTPPSTRGVVTAWFNPWAHQSGEQVWAGLVAEIIEAARPVLYPSETARERYWFARNLTRVDRFALRRTLHRRVLSPMLTFGALGVVASLAIAIAELETTVDIAGARVQTAMVALVIASTFLLLGALHTGWRFLRRAAARFLPGELFHGPVAVSPDVDAGPAGQIEGLSDPLRRARAGSLYLHQHDVSELVTDLDRAGYELMVFVDDLDRCRALTTAEVFEAINLFLAGFVSKGRRTHRESAGDPEGSLRARFVIGLDPVVVAGHLDRVYADLYDPATALDGEDPSPGWAFLRKLVHLPVLVPQVSDEEMVRVVGQITGVPAGPAAASGPRRPGLESSGGWRLPPDADINALVQRRLAAQPDRSIREATRQLNVWEFYERVLAATDPMDDPGAVRKRSETLVILAEVITRWPALQRFLHRRTDSRTGLQLLAAAAADDNEWRHTARTVFAGRDIADEALPTLRQLLRDHDGMAVADLASQLL
jgi:KAP family P-loop domain